MGIETSTVPAPSFACNQAVLDVLSAHADDVRNALAGVEQEGKGQPFLGADWVERFKLLDLVNCPRSVTLRPNLEVFNCDDGSSLRQPCRIAMRIIIERSLRSRLAA